jgi:hypothetical protein
VALPHSTNTIRRTGPADDAPNAGQQLDRASPAAAATVDVRLMISRSSISRRLKWVWTPVLSTAVAS